MQNHKQKPMCCKNYEGHLYQILTNCIDVIYWWPKKFQTFIDHIIQQGSVMLQNEGTSTILSNGLSAISSTEGVISYDFSGQVRNMFIYKRPGVNFTNVLRAAQLLRLQIPKVQNDSQVINVFLHFRP